MTSNRLWVLGASDPEMAAVERLLTETGERIAYAVGSDGQRVHPGNAYRATGPALESEPAAQAGTIYVVECGYADGPHIAAPVVSIDHHRPGDPGYGRPPEEYLTASSIGQVLSHLATVLDGDSADALCSACREYLFVAAADHCLEAAYRSRCPNVDPDALMRWRVESRAAFQGRTVEAVLADVEAARMRLLRAVANPDRPTDDCDAGYADLRGESIPELPEAACREGIPFLATVQDRDGRTKVVLQAATPQLIRRFMAGEIVRGLEDYYGDPARGFAGGYQA